VLLSPLLALSYFGIDEGAEELQTATVRAWAEPARDLAGGLLTWASPERVYATYVQAFALLFPAVFLCARAVRARRPAIGRNEHRGWRIALVGYGLASVGLVAAFFILIAGSAAGDALNVVFLTMMLPGMLISVIGSTVLGIALLRSRYTPRTTSWLLVLAFPSMLVVPTALGHNSLGMVPVFAAWGATGLQLWHAPDRAPAGELAATTTGSAQ
jgi:energy-converting hydrogenase Eha subunit A